jgi:hypothetical protein
MKKTFELTHPKIKVARVIDAVKHEVKKYIKRERNKTLPSGADYWDFDCKFGKTEQTSDVIHLSAINKQIDAAHEEGLTSFYLEILVKPAVRGLATEQEQE